ncbi:MAG TPA: cytochrome P460 family protein [Pyrinomonadaceae bacterium]|nr:cytochrome P460 family protein [Pyrinomonadaceae bacterium]
MNAAPVDLTLPAKSKAPGHEDIFASVYVNPAGHPVYVSEGPTEFPEGSVIVREKISGKQPLAPELLTVMVKREKNFNPASNDWEYMVLDGAGSLVLSRGKLDGCNSCHSRKKEADFVFRLSLPKRESEQP